MLRVRVPSSRLGMLTAKTKMTVNHTKMHPVSRWPAYRNAGRYVTLTAIKILANIGSNPVAWLAMSVKCVMNDSYERGVENEICRIIKERIKVDED